ncbi:hypothetical protein ACJX0J_025786, partial [Zea mays]
MSIIEVTLSLDLHYYHNWPFSPLLCCFLALAAWNIKRQRNKWIHLFWDIRGSNLNNLWYGLYPEEGSTDVRDDNSISFLAWYFRILPYGRNEQVASVAAVMSQYNTYSLGYYMWRSLGICQMNLQIKAA